MGIRNDVNNTLETFDIDAFPDSECARRVGIAMRKLESQSFLGLNNLLPMKSRENILVTADSQGSPKQAAC